MTKFLNISMDNTLGGVSPSDEVVSSQKAIKEYVDNNGGASIDNKSITKNSSNELQTIGVINQNGLTQAVKLWTGTKAQFDLLTPDANTLYNITDDETPTNFANTDLSNLSLTGQSVIDGKANTSLSNLSSAGQAILDGKVSKSGDTMTGGLDVPTSFNVYNSNLTKGTIPSSTQYSQIVFKDSGSGTWQSTRMGIIELTTNTDGSNEIGISASKNEANSTANSKIWSKIDSSGNKSCGFPNTKCVDGEWVYSQTAVASGISGTSSYSTDFDLSSYLPNDNYNYECLFVAGGGTSTSNGNTARIWLKTAISGQSLVACATTRTSSRMYCAGCATVIIGTNRKVTLSLQNSGGTTSEVYFNLNAYRRVGTNS